MARRKGLKNKKGGKRKKDKKDKKVKKDSLQTRIEKGIRFFAEEEYEKASSVFSASIKNYPDNPALLHMLAETKLSSKDLEGGREHYDRAFSLDPGIWTSWGLSNLLIKSKDVERAEEILKTVVEKYPSSPWGYLNLASFFIKQERLEDAMNVLDNATTCAEGLPVIWGLVQTMLEQNPTPEIAKQFSRFLVMTPDNWLGFHLLSRCLIRQEQYEEAIKTQQKAISFIRSEMSTIPRYLYPYYSSLMARVYLEKAMINYLYGDFDEVVTSGLSALRHDAKLWEVMYFLGVGYLYQGLLDKGRAALLKYSDTVDTIVDPDLLKIYSPARLSVKLLVGQSYISQSAFAEAIEIYKKLMIENPDVVEAYLNAGYSYYCLNNIEESKNMFKKLLGSKSDNLIALNNLGFLELHQRNFTEAKDYFSRAIDTSSDYPLPYCNLGFILAAEGEYEEAISMLLKALQVKTPEEASLKIIYPSSKEENIKMGGPPIEESQSISSHSAALCNLGTCAARMENYSDAHLCFDKLIELTPQAHYGYRGKGWTYFLENDLKKATETMRKAYEKNPENRALHDEYKFIKEKAGDIVETRKMASVLEGFFTITEKSTKEQSVLDMKKTIKKLKPEDLTVGEDLTIWDNLLIENPHVMLLEKKINHKLENRLKELEMISSWRNIEISDDEMEES